MWFFKGKRVHMRVVIVPPCVHLCMHGRLIAHDCVHPSAFPDAVVFSSDQLPLLTWDAILRSFCCIPLFDSHVRTAVVLYRYHSIYIFSYPPNLTTLLLPFSLIVCTRPHMPLPNNHPFTLHYLVPSSAISEPWLPVRSVSHSLMQIGQQFFHCLGVQASWFSYDMGQLFCSMTTPRFCIIVITFRLHSHII